MVCYEHWENPHLPKCFPSTIPGFLWSLQIFTLVFKIGILRSHLCHDGNEFQISCPYCQYEDHEVTELWQREEPRWLWQPSIVDTFCNFHNLAIGQTLLGFFSSFLHSLASPIAQLNISLALLKAVWLKIKPQKNTCYYYSVEQERVHVS